VAQVDDREGIFGCDAHDDNVTPQIEPPIIREVDVALEKYSKLRDGATTVGASVIDVHGDVVDVGLRRGITHDGLHKGEPCVLRIIGSAAGLHTNQGSWAMSRIKTSSD
jgi:hypothetical protein